MAISASCHGGLYKTGDAGSAPPPRPCAPVLVMAPAGGGSWGIALLAAYLVNKAEGESLGDYLDNRVFKALESKTLAPTPEELAGFAQYMTRFKKALLVERAALDQYNTGE